MSQETTTTTNSFIDQEERRSLSLDSSTKSVKINAIQHHSYTHFHTLQKSLLIWLNSNIDELNEDYRNLITQLRRFSTIAIIKDVDESIDFLTEIKDGKISMITSIDLGQQLTALIHDVPQLDSIFMLSEQKPIDEQWTRSWSKVKGIFTLKSLVCESLRHIARQGDHNSISVSFIPSADLSDPKIDELDQTFMYTQLLKEIILEIEYNNEEAIKDMAIYCRQQQTNQHGERNIFDNFEQEYYHHSPIWWYTSEYCLYSMVNQALRTQNIDVILKMSIFIRDLHQQLTKLHSDQSITRPGQIFTVYRGQGLSIVDFEKLMKNKGGLMSFNNFLSASIDQDVSFLFAESNATDPNLIGVFFEITINTLVSTAPFANLDNVSYYNDQEREVLFSMHTIFRMGEIKQISENNRLWQVQLTLTDDTDQQLKALTEQIRKETEGSTGWYRLGRLLIRLSELEKAHQVYQLLLTMTSDDVNKINLYHQIAVIKNRQGNYMEAFSSYHKTLELIQSMPHSDYSLLLATCYNNIGLVFSKIGEYSKALSYYQKGLEICEEFLPTNHSDLAASYNNIGSIYDHMRQYSTALLFYEKALTIYQQILPDNHPDLAASYTNIGLVYNEMGDYSKALSLYRKGTEIREKILPANHPDLATSYNNIGSVCYDMKEYPVALVFYQKAIEIRKKILSENHLDLAQSYSNIGLLYDRMGDYSNALSFHEKTVEIYEKVYLSNHPDLAACFNNIASVYKNMGDYIKALLFSERAIEIGQCSLPENHPRLQLWQRNLNFLRKKIEIDFHE